MISIIPITRDNFQIFQIDMLEIEKASFPSPWTANAFMEELDNPVSCMWALLADKKLSGYICFWMFAGEIHLMNIAISLGKRGKGLGSHLLARMLDYGRDKGVRSAWLEVRPSNRTARLLYEKAGFMETGRRKLYYKDTNEDAIVMTLSMPKHVGDMSEMS